MHVRSFRFALLVALSAPVVALADGAPTLLSQDAFLALPRSGEHAPVVLDVRTPEEYVAGHVPGAVNIPYDQVVARLADVPKDRDVVLYCHSGRRALLAADVLAGHGYTRLQHLEGDMTAWQTQQRALERPRDPAACVAALKEGKTRAEACQAAAATSAP